MIPTTPATTLPSKVLSRDWIARAPSTPTLISNSEDSAGLKFILPEQFQMSTTSTCAVFQPSAQWKARTRQLFMDISMHVLEGFISCSIPMELSFMGLSLTILLLDVSFELVDVPAHFRNLTKSTHVQPYRRGHAEILNHTGLEKGMIKSLIRVSILTLILHNDPPTRNRQLGQASCCLFCPHPSRNASFLSRNKTIRHPLAAAASLCRINFIHHWTILQPWKSK